MQPHVAHGEAKEPKVMEDDVKRILAPLYDEDPSRVDHILTMLPTEEGEEACDFHEAFKDFISKTVSLKLKPEAETLIESVTKSMRN